MKSSLKYYIETWGCQMNEEDSEKLSGMLKIKKYSRIYSDTLYSLDNQNILYDAIYWDKKKHIKVLIDILGGNILNIISSFMDYYSIETIKKFKSFNIN